MECYKVLFKDLDTTGVYNISLVESPAMESEYLALSKTEMKLSVVDEERRILLGAVLIPDKKIFRNQNGKEFYIEFPKETIALCLESFLKNGYQNNSTIEHDENLKLSDITFVENWIKEDDIHDKSIKYGFNEINGTWFTMMKAHTGEAWNAAKKMKGFSIDGFFDLEKINLNKVNMDIKQIVDAIKEGFAGKKEEVKLALGSVKTEDGTVTINFEGDTIAVGLQVTMTAPDGTELPVPDGDYKLEDGTVLTMAGSLVAEIATAETKEEEPAEVPAELAQPAAGQPSVKSEKHTQEVFYQLAKEMGLQMETKFSELKAELLLSMETKKEEVVSLTKAKPATSNEPQSAYEKFRNFNKQFN